MAVLSRTYRYLFIQMAASGCSSIAGILQGHLDGQMLPPEHVRDGRGRIVVHRKHASLREIESAGLLTAEEIARLFVFTTVRNPFDREVSRYAKQRVRHAERVRDPAFVTANPRFAEHIQVAMGRSFPEWVEGVYGPPIPPWRVRRRALVARQGRRYLTGANLVIRFEHLQEDFDEALRRLGVAERYKLPHVNPTIERTPDYRGYYDERSRRIVSQVYRYVIRRFGYRF